ncbi:MAG TPA: SIR2 family protein [Pyrinomonadaceae bacterium]
MPVGKRGANAVADSNQTKESPYRFLDYYRLEDRDIFFGRESEKRILLADVIVARLVVLFAQTGTGKTSLINAGVRPLLEEQGYATFFVRVKKDPVESARREILGLGVNDESQSNADENISSDGRLLWSGNSFAEKLENVARQLQKPIVLFFDQFEEFFIYPMEEEPAKDPAKLELQKLERKEQLAKRAEFVKDIAALYHDPKSRVHIVFSMREEWFVEMDIFRDEIPKIYHNDSNLRLLWFDLDQAREAIKRPVEEYMVSISDETVEELIKDIKVDDRIEPARLQIVCDTLWDATEGDEITLEDYRALGKPDGPDDNLTVAKRILFRRLEKEFEKIESDEHLYLFYALLPKLRTPNKTKYVRDIKTLVEKLVDDDPALREIITDTAERQELVYKLRTNGKQMLLELSDVLEKKLGLIRVGFRDGDEVIELSHDYLVGSIDDLQQRVKAIPPRRLLENWLASSENSDQPLPLETFEKISQNADVLKFDRPQAKAMFRSALAHGVYMKMCFDLAHPEDRTELLETKIKDLQETSNVIDLLAELQTPEAFLLLESILGSEEIASYAVEVFSFKETLPVVEFLAKALDYPYLTPQARKALSRFEKSRKNAAVAASARQVLQDFEAKQQEAASLEIGPGGGRSAAPPVELFRSSIDPALLEPHFRIVVKGLLDGRVIPFLGLGVNLMHRPQGAGWERGEFLPGSRELSALFAERFAYPSPHSHDLSDVMRVTQYVASVVGHAALDRELRKLFDADYPISTLHDFLATLPADLRNKGYAPRAQLILTTNYDDVLERAFNRAGEPFDLLFYSTEEGRMGKFIHRPPDGTPRVVENPNEYQELRSSERTVIIKVAGTIDRADARWDSYVITEDDYIEQLITDVSNLIPVTLAARLRRSNFLFLGHSLRSWSVRVILRRIWGDQKLSFKSWSIQFNPERIDQELWQQRGVDILNVPLDEYVKALKDHVDQMLTEV